MKETKIQGISTGQPSTIFCSNNAGIKFNENKKGSIFLTNLTIVNCKRARRVGSKKVPAALFFKHATYTLENVEVINSEGLGVYADSCNKQVLINCTFVNNSMGHIKIKFQDYERSKQVYVNITETYFYEGNREGSGEFDILIESQSDCILNLNIENTELIGNHDQQRGHVRITAETGANAIILIKNSIFSNSNRSYGVVLQTFSAQSSLNIKIQDSSFINNNGVLQFLSVDHVEIDNCMVANNKGIGIFIRADRHNGGKGVIYIVSNTVFSSNSRALYLYSENANSHHLSSKISNCTFKDHNLSTEKNYEYLNKASVEVENTKNVFGHTIILEKSQFVGNRGNGNCSCLLIKNATDFKISNVSITDNSCTGITLQGSTMTIKNWLNITGNTGMLGGGIQLLKQVNGLTKMFSVLRMSVGAKLSIDESSATLYGGAIFSDETCEDRNKRKECFFQFDVIPSTPAIRLEGNKASLGGDAIFGGCLSNCKLSNYTSIDVTDPQNMIASIISIIKQQSSSTFAEYPKQITFCSNTTLLTHHSM